MRSREAQLWYVASTYRLPVLRSDSSEKYLTPAPKVPYLSDAIDGKQGVFPIVHEPPAIASLPFVQRWVRVL